MEAGTAHLSTPAPVLIIPALSTPQNRYTQTAEFLHRIEENEVPITVRMACLIKPNSLN